MHTESTNYFGYNSPRKHHLLQNWASICTLETVTKLKAFSYPGSLYPGPKTAFFFICLSYKGDLLCVKEKALQSSPEAKLTVGMETEKHTCFLHLTVCPSTQLKCEAKLSVMFSGECGKTLADVLKTQIRTFSKGTQIFISYCRHLQPQLCQPSCQWHWQHMQPVTWSRKGTQTVPNDIKWCQVRRKLQLFSPRVLSVCVCATQFQITFLL